MTQPMSTLPRKKKVKPTPTLPAISVIEYKPNTKYWNLPECRQEIATLPTRGQPVKLQLCKRKAVYLVHDTPLCALHAGARAISALIALTAPSRTREDA